MSDHSILHPSARQELGSPGFPVHIPVFFRRLLSHQPYPVIPHIRHTRPFFPMVTRSTPADEADYHRPTLHKCGVSRTGVCSCWRIHNLRPDNIMKTIGRRRLLNPGSRRTLLVLTHPNVACIKWCLRLSLSHSPPPTLDALVSWNFRLADFSNAQFVSDQTTDDITPLGLHPPEVVSGGEWNESVDIRTYVCMVFTLLTGRPLF